MANNEPSQAQIKKQFLSRETSIKREVSTDTASDNAPKRVLRDQQKRKNPLETRYSDYDSYGLPSSQMKGNNDGMKNCAAILQKLKKHASAGPFLVPVDKNIVPDYYQKIRDPMDLSTVEKNLKAGVYSSVLEFAGDVRKIWNNALIYNDDKSLIFRMTKEMSAYFEKSFKEVESTSMPNNYQHLQRQVEKLSKEIKELGSQKSVIKTPPTSVKSQKTSSSAMDKPMNLQEKKQLGQMIRNLPPEYLRGVCQIVSDGFASTNGNQEVLEFDIDALPIRKTRELEKYVRAKSSLLKKNQSKKKSNKKGKAFDHQDVPDLSNTRSQEPLEQAGNAYAPAYGQQTVATHHNRMTAGTKANDIESRSSDSSFITDSDDSHSDGGRKKK